jgi:S1-C subfamily serine protease
MRGLIGGGLAAAMLLAVVAAAPGTASGQTPSDYQRILRDKAPAFVTIKFVLKMKMGGMGESETETEITGAMIDAKGLVLCSNTQLGGIGGFMRSMGREITATPTDIKVLVGDDTEGLEAKLLARDTELDLAWVQIKDPGDRKFAFVNLDNAAQGEVGQPVLAVRRMAKYFDRATTVDESRISGITKKPRKLYVPMLPLTGNLGLPVFTPDGKVLGVAILQMPGEEDQEESPAAMFSRMSNLNDVMSGMILPAADVVDATRRARQTAATQSADQEAATAKPTAPQPKPAPSAPEGD